MCLMVYFFFFKQQTAYEMRISDWSSDVCSSDLERPTRPLRCRRSWHAWQSPRPWRTHRTTSSRPWTSMAAMPSSTTPGNPLPAGTSGSSTRSEEHTSELQSLMRISYAVFCLKKKNNHTHAHSTLLRTPYVTIICFTHTHKAN